jgi:acyl carrier protein
VARLHLKDVDEESVRSETPLFEEGLGLDSLDALEITVLLEEEHGIVLSVAERNENVFGTLGTLAEFVRANRQRDIKKQ